MGYERGLAELLEMMQVQSYGGGVQSVALAILNAMGRVENPAKVAIMADPGMEERGTYEHLKWMEPWLAERGIELLKVRGQRGDPAKLNLWDYVIRSSTVIPVRTEKGLGRRQCTKNWKVDAIWREISVRNGHRPQKAVVQLGISWDEAHRMSDSRNSWIEHRYPLIEQRITRAGCRDIIRDAGLPAPPKSRCQFCPLQRQGSWRLRAAVDPEGFERCAQLEDAIIEREREKGHGPAYLSSTGKPLREAFPPGQAIMFSDDEEGDTCGGYCFT